MELKNPRPLGEKKLSDDGVTAKFLEIAKEKENKKFKIPKVTIPTIDDLKLIKPRKHGESIKEISPYSNTPTEGSIENHIPRISFKQFISTKVSPFLKTHKEKLINISLITLPLLILLILSISIITYTNSEPYRISKEFLQLIEKRDFKQAYELTSDAYKTITKQDQFEKSMTKLLSVDISNPKVKKKTLDRSQDMGEYAYIRYKVSGYYVDVTMFNDSLDWGVHSIEIVIIE